MMNHQEDEALEALLDAYFDGHLEEEARADLERLITSSAHVRERFWQRAALEGSLESWAAKTRGESLALPAVPRTAARRQRDWPAISGWAAAVLLLVGWGLHAWHRSAPSPAPQGQGQVTMANPPPAAPPTGGAGAAQDAGDKAPVAYLSRVSGLAADLRLVAGGALVAGREVAFLQGLIELDFYSGARVSIEGPARFRPESDMRLTVVEGKVQVDVPDSAKGFVLTLPDGTVTDFGTSFGAEVSAQKTSRLQVSRGEIELAGTRDGGAARRIVEGQAFSLAEGGGTQPIHFQPMGVKSSLDRRVAEANLYQMQRWEDSCREIDRDPALLVHFRFLAEEEGAREVVNRASAPGSPRTGTVIAAEWARGRWRDKPALSFHGPSDRVRVEVPGEYPQATYLCWVKADSLPRRYNGLFLSEYGIPGEAHWQLSPDGCFWFGVRPKEETGNQPFHRAFSDPVLGPADFGTWRMLATTYDANRREVVHYVDGREVHRSLLADSIPLRFGRATLGNYFDPDPAEHVNHPGLGEDWSFRNWSGSIDEFMLFSRALDPAEVAKLHEAGRPD